MRHIILFISLVVGLTTFSQAPPQSFNYQATVRDNSGNLLINTPGVLFKFHIHQNSATSLPIYSEVHMVATDNLGQVSLAMEKASSSTAWQQSTPKESNLLMNVFAYYPTQLNK